MIERTNYFSFRLFLVCLFVCAALVLNAIWHSDDGTLPEVYFRTTASLFVLGLASFLIWFTGTLRLIVHILEKLRQL